MASVVQHILHRFAKTPSGILSRLAKEDHGLVNEVVERNLTYLSQEKLYNLVDTCRTIGKAGVQGSFIEAGFATIPPPSEADGPDVHERRSGCRKAADEYFTQASPSLRMENRHGSMTITWVS